MENDFLRSFEIGLIIKKILQVFIILTYISII